MSALPPLRQTIPIDPQFYCDGQYYVLTSLSLGGSGLSPEQLAGTLSRGERAEMEALLQRGVCIPLVFDGDCALDGATVFVIGDLTEKEEHDWIGRLTWRLCIPCGRFALVCGGGDPGDFERLVEGVTQPDDAPMHQIIEVPPGDYRVDLYAYLSSMSVQISLETYKKHRAFARENTALREWYEANRPGDPDIAYIIRLSPLEEELSMPELDPEIGWCGIFEFRRPEGL
jgi:hypothetical protein